MQPSATSSRGRAGRAFAALLLAACPAVSLPAQAAGRPAGVFLTQKEALELAFPKAEIRRKAHFLTKEELARAKKLSGGTIPSALLTTYQGWKKGKLLGTAWFDTHRVRTLPETLMVVVDPKGRIARLEVLAFHEPKDYLPRGNWYAQFRGHALDKGLSLKKGIHGVTGATLTSRAVTLAVRRVLALHQVLFPAPKAHPIPAASGT